MTISAPCDSFALALAAELADAEFHRLWAVYIAAWEAYTAAPTAEKYQKLLSAGAVARAATAYRDSTAAAAADADADSASALAYLEDANKE